ncbi:hypothetical protein [Mesorhizobium sp.]|uniref:hypothetical protein n=1 Tax=Mesorhizobium sp. TaxID=1871066 RepID=UPI00120D1EA9|nr:hypothetical protein [Mesorhizobium sp.]TIL42773.1 MAG: hypothetical protein E5Y86_25530 [Mesorhizobium sp.]
MENLNIFGAARDFDKVNIRLLKEIASAAAVAQHYDAIFAESKSRLTGYNYEAACIINHAKQLSACLAEAHVTGPDKFALDTPILRPFQVLVCRNRGRHQRIAFENDDLILIDRDALVRAALFVYFRDLSAPAAAAILMHACRYPDLPIPFQEHVFFHASQVDGPRLWPLLNTVMDFVVFHELGHAYEKLSTSSQRSLLQMSTVDASFSAVMDADSENVRYLVSPIIGDGFKTYYGEHQNRGLLLIPESKVKYLPEFFCDAFSLACQLTLARSEEAPKLHIALMPVRLKIVATSLFLTELVDGHKDGLIFDKRLDNLHLWQDQPKIKSALSIYDTHPRPVLRFLSLLFHGELFAEIYQDIGIARIFEKIANDIGFQFKPFNLISIDEIIEASKRIQHEDGASTDELEFFQAIDAASDSFWNDYPEFLQRIMVRAFGKFITSTAVSIGSELVRRIPTSWMDRPEFDGECQSIKLWSALSKRLHLKWGRPG